MFGAGINEAIRAHAAAEHPKESCGLVTLDSGVPKYVAVANISETPEATFQMPSSAWTDAGDVVGVAHSHPGGPACPSEEDMRRQIESAVPWAISVSGKGAEVASAGEDGKVTTEVEPCADKPFWFGKGVPVLPLVGRPFRHGVTDCYALIKDYYFMERGIELPEYPRGWGWWEKGQDLYVQGFEAAGFEITHDMPHSGDVFLAKIRSPRINHGGVLLDGGLILHHPAGGPYAPDRLSFREPGNRWRNYVVHWLRYTGSES